MHLEKEAFAVCIRLMSMAQLDERKRGGLGGRCGAPVVTPDGRPIIYGSGGYAVHYQLMCRRALGLRASEHLLDAMFDGKH